MSKVIEFNNKEKLPPRPYVFGDLAKFDDKVADAYIKEGFAVAAKTAAKEMAKK